MTPTSTSTCHDPGWFGGCRDSTTTTTAGMSPTVDAQGYYNNAPASIKHAITAAPVI
jgi:lipase ATG15